MLHAKFRGSLEIEISSWNGINVSLGSRRRNEEGVSTEDSRHFEKGPDGLCHPGPISNAGLGVVLVLFGYLEGYSLTRVTYSPERVSSGQLFSFFNKRRNHQ